jgi:hypothetical protein
MQPPDESSVVSGGQDVLWPIADFQLAPPPTWAKIPVAPTDDVWPAEVAERLVDDPLVRQGLATMLATLHLDLLGPDPHVMAAVWVPDPARGYVDAVLTVDWMLADPGAILDLPYYRALWERTKRPNLEVLAQHLEDVSLPAGPALRIRERTSHSSGRLFTRRRRVAERVIFTVFPPGSSDALQLIFETDALNLADAMAEDADAMVASLNVLLEEPDAAT